MPSREIIKVFIVDDSQVSRELLAFIIESDPEIKVIGFADDGEKALEMLKYLKPDVVTMDIVMPKMNGYEATRKIMQSQPIPIVVISGIYEKGDITKSFQAIESGALAILEKPVGLTDANFDKKKKEILETIKIMSGTKLIKRHHWQSPKDKSLKEKSEITTKEASIQPLLDYLKVIPSDGINAVVIGASLGGPQALALILAELPNDFPVPIYIVQHIAPGFIQGLISWLSSTTSLKVLLAENGMHGLPGCVYIAPDKFHLEIKKGNIMALVDSAVSGGLKPSVSKLFHSAAHTFGAACVGIILTGMGRDGVEELLLMKNKGAFTIAQDEDTCVIFGMPGEAIKIGAAKYVVPLPLIPIALKEIIKANHSDRQKRKNKFL